jgi:hypothetical protein
MKLFGTATSGAAEINVTVTQDKTTQALDQNAK